MKKSTLRKKISSFKGSKNMLNSQEKKKIYGGATSTEYIILLKK